MVNAQDFGFNHANCIGMRLALRMVKLYHAESFIIDQINQVVDTDLRLQRKIQQAPAYVVRFCGAGLSRWQKADTAQKVCREPNSVHAQMTI